MNCNDSHYAAVAVPVSKKQFYLSPTSQHTRHGENPNKKADAPVSKENYRCPVSSARPLGLP